MFDFIRRLFGEKESPMLATSIGLVNPGFEAAGPGLPGWTVYHRGPNTPESNLERLSNGASPLVVAEGDASLRLIAKWESVFRSGIYQTVESVPPGRARLIGSGLAWASENPNGWPEAAHDPRIFAQWRIGIDPFGGTDPDAHTVTWAAFNSRDHGHLGRVDRLRRLSIESPVPGGPVTFFAEASIGIDWGLPVHLAILDGFEAVLLPQGDPPPPPPPDPGPEGDSLEVRLTLAGKVWRLRLPIERL